MSGYPSNVYKSYISKNYNNNDDDDGNHDTSVSFQGMNLMIAESSDAITQYFKLLPSFKSFEYFSCLVPSSDDDNVNESSDNNYNVIPRLIYINVNGYSNRTNNIIDASEPLNITDDDDDVMP